MESGEVEIQTTNILQNTFQVTMGSVFNFHKIDFGWIIALRETF